MRITFALPFAGLSGGVRIVASFAERLQQRGHRVLVVSLPPQQPTLRQKVKQFARGRGWHKPGPVLSHLDRANVEHRVLDRPRPITDADVPQADVIIATWWETAQWVAALSPSRGEKIYFIQQFEANFGMPEAEVVRTWEMPLKKIVCSEWLAKLALRRFGQTVIAVTPNGVDLELFQAPRRGKQSVPTVGMMYAHNPVKGCDISLAALNKVRERIPNLRLIAYGEQEVIDALPLPCWATYTFHPAQEALREIYAQCDVWLCGSRSEGFHLPPHEAMACRCPVVSSRVGGPMDMIEDGVNGYLVDPEEINELADRLQRVLTLPEADWRHMSDAALETARRFNWDTATDKFEHALELAAGKKEKVAVHA